MFYHASDFTIQNSTFNDVAGNQVINTYHNSQIIKIASSQSGSSRIDPSNGSTILPTFEPFKGFVELAVEVQRALFPIVSIIDEPSVFDPLKDDLMLIIKSASFLSRVLELVQGNPYFPSLFGGDTIETRCFMYSQSLKRSLDEIRRYQEGLKFTLIGPIWRRVLCTIRRDLDASREPFMSYLRKLREDVWWKEIRVLPEDVVSSLETLSVDISEEIPSVDEVELRHVLIDFDRGCTLPVPLSSCATYKNMEIFFRCITGHVTSEIQCFIDSSDGRVIERSRFNELVTSKQTTQELVFVPIWSNVSDKRSTLDPASRHRQHTAVSPDNLPPIINMPRDATKPSSSRPSSSPYPAPLLPSPEIRTPNEETSTPTKRKASARGRPKTDASPSRSAAAMFIPKGPGRSPDAGEGVQASPSRTRRTIQSMRLELANRPFPAPAPRVDGLRGKDYAPSDITSPDGKKVLKKTLRPEPERKIGVKRFDSIMIIEPPREKGKA
ncbi:hypothetical protein EYR38_003298 [Pleurotus pulmonarius]|nr:hypothetical protein EYR38_003298 [Pleurotus pulmonarius]